MTGNKDIIALAGFMRQRGEADACLNRLLADRDLLSFRKWVCENDDSEKGGRDADGQSIQVRTSMTWNLYVQNFLKQFLISPILCSNFNN